MLDPWASLGEDTTILILKFPNPAKGGALRPHHRLRSLILPDVAPFPQHKNPPRVSSGSKYGRSKVKHRLCQLF